MVNRNTLVSIIVPVYGTECYLPACIDSLCKQSYPNLQIILVDDQSPDRCPEICDRYARIDLRITVIHQKNKGVSAARNAGLNIAIGEYILFVDSDDILYPNAVEVLLQDAQRYAADIVSAPPEIIDITGRIIGQSKNDEYVVFQKEESLLWSLNGGTNSNSVWSKLFRADFIRGISFEEGKNINEDSLNTFQCYMRKPMHVRTNISVYQYRIRPSSESRQVFSDKYLSMLYFCRRKKELITMYYPQNMLQAYNMEVRTNLQLLDVLCSTKEKKYNELQKKCVYTVRSLYKYHRPVNKHHRLQAIIVVLGLYPLYKWAVRRKYYSRRK